MTEEESSKVYNIAMSIRNSSVSVKGQLFESLIEEYLTKKNITHFSQSSVNLNLNKYQLGHKQPVVDFVIPLDQTIQNVDGLPIEQSIIISCKYTCRERYKQDDWTQLHVPKHYILLIGSNDYPKCIKQTTSRAIISLINDPQLTTLTNLLVSLLDQAPTKDVEVEQPDKQKRKLRYIDLCCGIGSFHYGMQHVLRDDSECVMACDISVPARQTYQTNYCIEPLTDLTMIDYSKYQADVVFSGCPCQPFSLIGQQGGLVDPRGNVFMWIIDHLMSLKRYPVFVFENVHGLLTHNRGKTFKTLTQRMADYGYEVTYVELCASDYGIPQQRQRVFIVAALKTSKLDLTQFANTLEALVKPSPTLTDYLNIGYEFKRDVAYTVRCGGVGSPITSRQCWDSYYLADDSVYRLTLADIKRLQGFPQDFELKGTKTQQYVLLGNTIPTCLSIAVCSALKQLLHM